MAGKKFPKDVDFAAGFFSVSPSGESSSKITPPEKITAPSATKTTATEQKNLGGRPKKEGLKNEQFTLTMHPEMYEKLRIISKQYTNGNFSALINAAVTSFCAENKINLADVKVDPKILNTYKVKQEKKAKKK